MRYIQTLCLSVCFSTLPSEDALPIDTVLLPDGSVQAVKQAGVKPKVAVEISAETVTESTISKSVLLSGCDGKGTQRSVPCREAVLFSEIRNVLMQWPEECSL